jgi:hypothetical protein
MGVGRITRKLACWREGRQVREGLEKLLLGAEQTSDMRRRNFQISKTCVHQVPAPQVAVVAGAIVTGASLPVPVPGVETDEHLPNLFPPFNLRRKSLEEILFQEELINQVVYVIVLAQVKAVKRKTSGRIPHHTKMLI